jgi:hypothetical protein
MISMSALLLLLLLLLLLRLLHRQLLDQFLLRGVRKRCGVCGACLSG